MPGTVLSMQNIHLVKKNYANPPEGDTKPPEDSASMKFVYHQLNRHFAENFSCANRGITLSSSAELSSSHFSNNQNREKTGAK